MEKSIYTSGIFDLMHCGHVETLNRIQNLYPDHLFIIGVSTDEYAKSFKRVPYQTLDERMNSIRTIYPDAVVIEDPLLDYKDYYKEEFYEDLKIEFHIQGSSFPENPRCYDYITRKGRFVEIGRSDLMSTSKIISRIMRSDLKDLGGVSNNNYLTNNMVVKKLKFGIKENYDRIYNQLVEKGLFGITRYFRDGDVIFLPYIEGEVKEQDLDKIYDVIKSIQNCGLGVDNTLLDLFESYEFEVPTEYEHYFSDMDTFCHGDTVYVNFVNHKGDIIPIDWEYACMGVENWDMACYIVSLYIYDKMTIEQIRDKVKSCPELADMIVIVALYWLQWSRYSNERYFRSELTYLSKNLIK